MGYFSFFNNKRRQLRRRRRNNADPESDREEPANVESEEVELKEGKVEYILLDTDNDSNESVSLCTDNDSNEREEDPDLSVERTEDDEEEPEVDFKGYILPTKEELEQELLLPVEDLIPKLQKRSYEIASILNNSELYTFDNKSLYQDFVDQYVADICFNKKNKCAYKRLVELLGPKQTWIVLCQNFDMSRTCICINHWKAHIDDVVADFMDNAVMYKHILWCDGVLVADAEKKDLRRLASYKEGHFTILKSSCMFLPVMTLEPQENERICNLRAFTGDGTFYIALLMKNTGTIIASVKDELSRRAFVKKLKRMGVTNTYSCGLEQLSGVKKNFDKVMLCAPSTEQRLGSGVLEMTETKAERNIQKNVKVQKEMLLAAIDMLKPKGYVVYCTLSLFIDENEAVVDHALNNRNVKLVDVPKNVNAGNPGFTSYGEKKFHDDMKKARRYYPHINNMDVLFLAKLQKLGRK